MSDHSGHWEARQVPNPQKYHGFVYLIVNKYNGMYYIGRKMYGGGNAWRSYTGSCKPLNEDIKKYGKKWFTFTILGEFETKAAMNYMEERLQYIFDVLHDEKYYNKNIGGKRYANQECNQDTVKENALRIIEEIKETVNEQRETTES